jgi:hypothetical protein
MVAYYSKKRRYLNSAVFVLRSISHNDLPWPRLDYGMFPLLCVCGFSMKRDLYARGFGSSIFHSGNLLDYSFDFQWSSQHAPVKGLLQLLIIVFFQLMFCECEHRCKPMPVIANLASECKVGGERPVSESALCNVIGCQLLFMQV